MATGMKMRDFCKLSACLLGKTYDELKVYWVTQRVRSQGGQRGCVGEAQKTLLHVVLFSSGNVGSEGSLHWTRAGQPASCDRRIRKEKLAVYYRTNIQAPVTFRYCGIICLSTSVFNLSLFVYIWISAWCCSFYFCASTKAFFKLLILFQNILRALLLLPPPLLNFTIYTVHVHSHRNIF